MLAGPHQTCSVVVLFVFFYDKKGIKEVKAETFFIPLSEKKKGIKGIIPSCSLLCLIKSAVDAYVSTLFLIISIPSGLLQRLINKLL
jgi:hypothetical protein